MNVGKCCTCEIDGSLYEDEMIRLMLHWFFRYLPEEFLGTQLEHAPSSINQYLRFTLAIFLDEFQHNHPIITYPTRRERDAKSIIIFSPDGISMRLSAVVDG